MILHITTGWAQRNFCLNVWGKCLELTTIFANVCALCVFAAADPTGVSWQPYSDFLVYSVLAALPWCASDLGGECPAEFASLMAATQSYMDARPSTHDAYLQPFYGSRSETDLAAM